MSETFPADPAACSRLGGALRSLAQGLSEAAVELADGSLRRDVEATLSTLDMIGSLVQGHAQDLAEAAASRRRLDERARAAGLVVRDGRVVEPMGPVSADVARRRLAAQPGLQGQADRIASRLGKARAGLTRALERAESDLDACTARVTDGLSTG